VKRPFILALALALALAGVLGIATASGQEKLTPVTLMVHWRPQAQFAGYYAAYDRGFYKEHGLDVTILRGGPDRDPAASLKSGEADFVTLFLTGALTLRDGGLPLVNLAQVINRSSLLLVSWADKVKTLDDLDARRISLWGMDFQAAYLGLFEERDVSPLTVPQYYTVNLFLRRGVDACAAMEYNEYHTILQAGIDPEQLTTFALRDMGFDFPEDGIYCLEGTLADRPEICRAFAEASLEGWQYAKDNPDLAMAMVMNQVRQDHVPTNWVHQRWMLDKILACIFPGPGDTWQTGRLAPNTYARVAEVLEWQGLMASFVPYQQFCAGVAAGAP
jgi:NitT/TauT family transport system substrate-binding protein